MSRNSRNFVSPPTSEIPPIPYQAITSWTVSFDDIRKHIAIVQCYIEEQQGLAHWTPGPARALESIEWLENYFKIH